MKALFRFSLAALLFLTVLIAGYLGGYQNGFDVGKSVWVKHPVYPKTYAVEDLVMRSLRERNTKITGNKWRVTQSSFDPLIAEIKKEVRPIAWLHDPNVTVTGFVPNISLIIPGNALLHHDVEQHLAIARMKADLATVGRENSGDYAE